MAEADVRIEGRVGRITLNRPDALNALNRSMMDLIDTALVDWAEDDRVRMVLIDGAGERSFCAGGDITELYRRTKAGDLAFGRDFWRDEYRLNARIAAYPKPYVALMDGITMGGGVGLSAHGSHRIVSERTRIAMPECSIGLVPDVGGSWLLGRAPGQLGDYLGLAGARMGPADGILAGFADSFVPADRLPDLVRALVDDAEPGLIDHFAETPPPGEFEAKLGVIDTLFAHGTVQAILSAIEVHPPSDWRDGVRQALAGACPLSLHCALRLIREARSSGSLRQALAREYRFTWRSLDQGDFLEGIRAAVIDKDRNPRWTRSGIGDVTAADADAMLAGLGDHELTFNSD